MSIDRWFSEFEEHWRELRGGRVVPRRSDFHPGRMMRHVSRLLIIDRSPMDQFIVSLVGQDLEESLGQSLCGRDAVGIFQTHNAGDGIERGWSEAALHTDLMNVVEGPMLLDGLLEGVSSRGQTRSMQFKLLPFAGRCGRISKIFMLLDVKRPLVGEDVAEIVRITHVSGRRKTPLAESGDGVRRRTAEAAVMSQGC